MHKPIILLLFCLLAMCSLARQAGADLAAYLHRREPAYRWEKTGEQTVPGGTVYDLHLVSQTWHGITWQHHLQIFRPDHLTHPHFCTLLNTGGSGSQAETQEGIMAAQMSGAVFAILFDIPNQPLFGGLTEDALVVYTWEKFLETGDESWPLHFPMAKAVLKAMDAIQAFTKSEKQPAITDFLITGASKRGWTTWLVGASQDKRVKAIAPMVIDTLNIPAQGPHQLAAYGTFSEQIDDYTRAGIPQKLQTPEGKRLLQLEDPYSYRDILTLPKLIILGTNDRYWAQDALNLYWDGLKGPKWILYDPNSGHGLEDRLRVYGTLLAFADAIATHTPWPKMHWSYSVSDSGANLSVGSDIPGKSAQLWHAHSATQDFRDSKWTSEPMTPAHDGFTGHLDRPADGYTATFGEVTYEINGKTFNLSTQIHILEAKNSGAQ